jgi:tripartite-type tricarboxylate transporter receptor subunit TctC
MLACNATAHAQADTYPTKPVRVVIGFAPGGSLDIISRMIAPRLGELLGQQIIVDNRPGASGNIGTEMVARASPDGYTLTNVSLPFVVNPHLVARAPYHPVNDFAAIGLICNSPSLVAVHPSLPVHTVKELLALAKARPGQIHYASAGIGTNPHVAGELFNLMGKTTLVPVHFKGGGPGLIAALSGEVSATFINIAETSAYVRANKLRALAVTSAKRSAAFPALPTVAEGGLPGYEFMTWFGALAPAKTPARVVTLFNEQLNKTMATPQIQKRFAERGQEIATGTPADFAAHVKTESERWARVVKERGMRSE